MWRYEEIKNLKEVKKDEEVCAVYPESYKNMAGKKHRKKSKKPQMMQKRESANSLCGERWNFEIK